MFFPRLLAVTSTLLMRVSSQAEIKGPPRAHEPLVTKVGRVGERNLRLQCPIFGYPPPIFEWKKDGQVIDDVTWTRYRKSKNSLKIRHANLDDTGVYACKGVNGFGSVEAIVELIVVDSTKYPPELTPDGRTLDVAPPVFTLRTRQAEKQVDKEAGDMFRITCEALGSPRPSIRWFKDGQEILESVVPRGRDVQGSSSVELQVLGTVDAGTYTCLARNSVGFKEQNFTLRVIAGRKLASRAVVTAAGDASVATGGRAELRCYVQAQKTPTVQWLKKLQQDQLDHDPSEVLSVHTLRMGSERYQLLQSAEAAEDKESSGRFVSTLVIAEADVSDSGLYLCFVTNAGFGALTYKSARLNVVASQESGDKSFLALMLGVLVASACAGVGVVACLVRARVTKKQQVEEVGKTNQQELQQQRPFLLCESPDLLPPPSLPHAFPPAPMLSWSRRSVYPSETNHYESPTKLMNQYEVPYSHLRSSSQSSHSGNFCASQHNFSASLSSFRQPPQGSRVTAARTLGAPPPLRNYHCSFRYDLQ